MFEGALELLALAEASTPDELQAAQVELLRGQIAFASSMGPTAPPLLLKAAQRLERLDPELARETYLDAWGAALFAGRLASAGSLVEVSRAATIGSAADPPAPSIRSAARWPQHPRHGRTCGGRATAEAGNGRVRGRSVTGPGELPLGLADDDLAPSSSGMRTAGMPSARAISGRRRDAGALARLPIDLTDWAIFATWCGDFGAAAVAIAELEAITKATGTPHRTLCPAVARRVPRPRRTPRH